MIKKDATDVALSIRTSDEEILNWDRDRIVGALLRETNIDKDLAEKISSEVEKQILSTNIKTITTSLVRELVNAKLIELGLEKERLKHDRLGVPIHDVENLIMSHNKENSNVPHGPEATNLTLAEVIKKEFALRKVFSKDVGEAHLKGDIHLHDLGFCDRVYCSGQSLEYVKKFGLNLPNALAIAKPAHRAEVLLAHMVKFAAALQCHYAGAIGWDAVNIFFAPYLVGKPEKEIKQLAQMLVFEFSQQAVARGGQSIFSLVHDENVWIKRDDKIEFRKIGEVVDEALKDSNIVHAEETYEYTTENENKLKVIAFDNNYKTTFSNISSFIRIPYKGKMYRLRTQHGIIKGISSEHAVFIFDGKKVVSKRVEELTINDYIIVPRKVDLPQNQTNLNVAAFYLNREESDNYIRVKYGKETFKQALIQKFGKYCWSALAKCENIPLNRITTNWLRYDKIPLKIYHKYVGNFDNVKLCIKGDSPYEISPVLEINSVFLKILGYYVSEGTDKGKGKSSISICNKDPGVIKSAYDSFIEIANNSTIRQVKDNGLSNVYCQGIFARLIVDLCEDNKGIKVIPYFIFSLSKEKKEIFMKNFWDGDGLLNCGRMKFLNTSENVISGLALLSASLNKEFKIYEEKREVWKTHYILDWTTANRIIDHKLDRYVPNTEHKFRKRIDNFLEDKENLEVAEKYKEELIAIDRIIDSDLGFSRVLEISEYDYDGYIYDFSVKPTESFAGSTGLIFFHNTDCNIYWEIPKHFENTPAIGPGGEYTGKTYKDYEKESQQFAWALLDVYKEGDGCGRPFFFPKILIHMTEKFFQTSGYMEFLIHTCEVASKMGSPYFVFDRGSTAKISECCRLSFKLTQKDLEDAKYPWKMRYCAFQNVTLNLPRIGYIYTGDKIFDRITKLFNLTIKAHLQKYRFIKKIFGLGAKGPLALLAMNNDGDPYLKIDKASYLIGMVGLNELVKTQYGHEMHESEEAFKYGLSIIAHMKILVDKAKEEHNMHFVLEQSPAEATSHRFARLDLKYYPEKSKEIILGDISTESVYYTNSTQLNSGVAIDPITRVNREGLFHPLIEAGSISNLFVGEHEPSAESLANFVIKVFRNTKNDQITFSPEFTSCLDCFKTSRGLSETCSYCGSTNVEGITRITGYFSKISGWNKGKLSELADRARVKI
jgi:anaerobic ribonucleoside-triphosphate reductase